MRPTPAEDLLTEEALDALIWAHIDTHHHLVNVREWFSTISSDRHLGHALCTACREVIGESTFGAERCPLDLDAIDWGQADRALLEHREMVSS